MRSVDWRSEHVVMLSAEHYADLQQVARRSRLTGSLTAEERALAAAAAVPSGPDQQRPLAEFATAVGD